MTGADEIYKAAGINDLYVFFDYASRKEDLFVEHLVKPYKLESFVDFAKLECEKGMGNHRYLLSPLNIELRTVINKDPKKNMHPQITAELKIGSTFGYVPGKGRKESLALGVEVQQITIGMKAMEFVGMYSKFQTEALSQYQEKQFTEEQRGKYEDVYGAYIYALRHKNQKALDAKRSELENMEERFSVTAIKKVRVAAKLELDFEERKEEVKKETEKKVKDLESQQSSTISSIGCTFPPLHTSSLLRQLQFKGETAQGKGRGCQVQGGAHKRAGGEASGRTRNARERNQGDLRDGSRNRRDHRC